MNDNNGEIGEYNLIYKCKIKQGLVAYDGFAEQPKQHIDDIDVLCGGVFLYKELAKAYATWAFECY